MKKAEISFRIIGGSGPVSIYFKSGPYGDAVEAKNGIGVGFFSQSGELLAVEFDDVVEKKDCQTLEFDRYQVEVEVNCGKISHKVEVLEGCGRKKRAAA